METEESGGEAGLTYLLCLDDWRRHSRCAFVMRVCGFARSGDKTKRPWNELALVCLKYPH